MTSPRILAAAALLVLPLTLAACGGDKKADDSASSSTKTGSSSDASTTTTASGAAPTGGTGTGTVTVGDKTWNFDLSTCAIKGEVVEASGKGTLDGQPFTAVVRRSVSTSTLETVQLALTSTKTEVATNFASDKSATKLKVADSKVDGTMTFTGGEGLPSGDGTVSVTCKS